MHVAVEGPLGVGKTTLARRLAARWKAREVLEDVANPFLDAFHQGQPGAAFQCQVYFLLTRYRLQQELLQQDLFTQPTVADHLFLKDKIYAYLNLEQDELNIYERVFGALVEQVAKPDLVIFLQAPDEVLVQRMKKRGRPEETRLSREYVSELNKAYNYFFFHYDEAPLLVVDTTSFDLAEGDAELDELVRQVERIEGGTRYYVPA